MTRDEPCEEEVKASAPRPDLSTESGQLAFIQVLNDRLPTKRLIAQGLLRNERGEVLLCELVYKSAWDLPGGVVDPGESPATCVHREVTEELGLDLPVGSLAAVNWLPPYRGWDDALLLLFDLGTVDSALMERAVLQPREIRAVHWVAPDDLADHVAPYTVEMIRQVATPGPTRYLENSQDR